jgi:acetoin utilization protein AcuB
MLVGERMTRNLITILETSNVADGLQIMRECRVRRLPVLNADGQLVGIVSDKDLLHAAPSPATSLSVYELHYLLAKLTIKPVMSSPVVTVTSDTPIEGAARIMADSKIGGLPVVDGGRLVGIITVTDIFKVLLELLGARTHGVRVTVKSREAKGVLAHMTRVLADANANIASVAAYIGDAVAEPRVMFKLTDVDVETVKSALVKGEIPIVDLRMD